MTRGRYAWKYKQDRQRLTVTITCPVCGATQKTRHVSEWCNGPRAGDHNAIWYRFPAEAEADVARIRHASPDPEDVVALPDVSGNGSWRVDRNRCGVPGAVAEVGL